MNAKITKWLILMIFPFLVLINSIFAASLEVNDGDLVIFKEVKVNGIVVYYNNITNFYETYVYPGEKINVSILYKGVKNDNNVRVVVSLPGYDYKLLYTISKEIQIVNGTYKKITGTITLPEDIKSGEYTLRIEFVSDEGSDYIELPIIIQKPAKSILMVDTEVFPTLLKYSFDCSSCAENKIKVLVRLENRGEETLKHVNVVAYLKEYPDITKTVVYLYNNRNDQFNGQLEPGEVASLVGTIDLNTIPFALKSGTYHVEVEVRYDYNHKVIKKEQTIQIVNIDEYKQKNENEENTQQQKPSKVTATSNSIEVSINPSKALVLNVNEQGTYNITIKNKEDARVDLKILVDTVPQVKYEVDPAKVSIQPLGTATVKVKLSAIESGTFPVKIRILNDQNQEIYTINTVVKVNNQTQQIVLWSIVAVLIVLIIFILIALILKKNSKTEREKIVIEREKGPNIKVEEDELY